MKQYFKAKWKNLLTQLTSAPAQLNSTQHYARWVSIEAPRSRQAGF